MSFPAGPASRAPRARLLRRRPVRTLLCAVAVLGSALAAGCAVPAKAAASIQLSSAQIVLPTASRVTDAYVDVTNNGPADKLVAAKLSVGGRIALRSPVRAGQVQMR